jgi:3-oxoacyl-(acyl-carrier-protein) synthase
MERCAREAYHAQLMKTALSTLAIHAQKRKSVRRTAARFVHQSLAHAWEGWLARMHERQGCVKSAHSLRCKVVKRWNRAALTAAFEALKAWGKQQQLLRAHCTKVGLTVATILCMLSDPVRLEHNPGPASQSGWQNVQALLKQMRSVFVSWALYSQQMNKATSLLTAILLRAQFAAFSSWRCMTREAAEARVQVKQLQAKLWMNDG